MKKYGRRAKLRRIRERLSGKTPVVILILLLCVILKIAASGDGEMISEKLAKGIVSNKKLTQSILKLELGLGQADNDSPALKAALRESALLDANSDKLKTAVGGPEEEKTPSPPEKTEIAVSAISQAAPQKETMPPAQSNQQTETPLEPGDVFYAPAEQIKLHNSTDYEPDIAALLSGVPNVSLEKGMPQVLIIHTHSSEAYTGEYAESDYFRTEDKSQSVIKVGDELAAALEERGIKTMHDRNIYDYPSYTGSYSRTLSAVENYIANYPSIAVVIDLHRDALQNADGTEYRTDANIAGESSSQLMLVIGTGQSGLEHPNWEQNLTLAVHLQAALQHRWPELCRPIALTKERYNQHLSPGYFILEVGSTGNTLDEAVTAARHFAESAADVLLQYEK